MSSSPDRDDFERRIAVRPNQQQSGANQALFRQALQDPNGAMTSICSLGDQLGLPVTTQEVREHLASLDDDDSKRWMVKARGGL